MKKNLIVAILTILGFSLIGFQIYVSQRRAKDLKIVPLSARASYLTTQQSLANIAAPNLERLILDAEKNGMCLIVVSGYRTRERQEKLYREAEDKTIVAPPGTSEHETGLAVDFGGCPMIDGIRNDNGERLELRDEFETLPEYSWLIENAGKYIFEQSYTEGKSKKTGFPAEPWHWRFKYNL